MPDSFFFKQMYFNTAVGKGGANFNYLYIVLSIFYFTYRMVARELAKSYLILTYNNTS